MNAVQEEFSGGVWLAQAELSNARHMAELRKPLAAAIAEAVDDIAGRPMHAGMRYDEPSRRAYYLQNNGKVLTCVTFDHVKDLQQAAEIWEAIDNGTEYREAYSRVTGLDCSLIDQRH